MWLAMAGGCGLVALAHDTSSGSPADASRSPGGTNSGCDPLEGGGRMKYKKEPQEVR